MLKMTMNDKILLYMYNKVTQLEEEYKNHESYFRFHPQDEIDLTEQIILKVRKDTANEILSDIMSIISLKGKVKCNYTK